MLEPRVRIVAFPLRLLVAILASSCLALCWGASTEKRRTMFGNGARVRVESTWEKTGGDIEEPTTPATLESLMLLRPRELLQLLRKKTGKECTECARMDKPDLVERVLSVVNPRPLMRVEEPPIVPSAHSPPVQIRYEDVVAQLRRSEANGVPLRDQLAAAGIHGERIDMSTFQAISGKSFDGGAFARALGKGNEGGENLPETVDICRVPPSG